MNKFFTIAAAVFLLSGCGSNLKEYSGTRMLMGTVFEVKLYSHDRHSAEKNITAAFDEISRLENIFSVFIPTSDVSVLNASGRAKVSGEVIELTEKSKYYSKISDGAFDITVLPVIELWKKSKETGCPPAPSEIAKAKILVGSDKITVDAKNGLINFALKGMRIDFGGIAKGYAVDKAYSLLIKNGVTAGIVNAGGNMRVWGDKMWNIALQDPRDSGRFVTVLKLKNTSVSTSGDYERYFFLDKKRVSHIINPSTGYSADESISATIITETATDADALSTAVFVLGPEKGIGLIKNIGTAQCLVIDNRKKIYRSHGFEKYE